jgi:hypothetical protein
MGDKLWLLVRHFQKHSQKVTVIAAKTWRRKKGLAKVSEKFQIYFYARNERLFEP